MKDLSINTTNETHEELIKKGYQLMNDEPLSLNEINPFEKSLQEIFEINATIVKDICIGYDFYAKTGRLKLNQ